MTLFYYIPLWSAIVASVLWAIWMQWTTARPSPSEIQIARLTGAVVVTMFFITFIPLILRKDGFRTWIFRAALLPLAFALLGIFLLILLICIISAFIR